MRQKINHPKHYNIGSPEVIDIIAGWGMEGDFCAGNVLKYFLRAPYKGKEEDDYRKCNWYLERMYGRDIANGCDLLYHDRVKCSPIRLRTNKINLMWFKINDFHSEVTLEMVINGWSLTDKRKDFIMNFFYQNFNIERCLRIVSDLIDDVAENEDDEL